MEREIKFRGKRLDSGEWAVGNFLSGGDRAFIHRIGQSLTSTHIAEVEPKSVGQFTGLLDKNGVEIFEGDAVKATGEKRRLIGSIVYDERVCRFMLQVKDFGYNFLTLFDFDYEFKVIGNVHERRNDG
jgi:uncharacterized phage protein (TIGR01671 family)